MLTNQARFSSTANIFLNTEVFRKALLGTQQSEFPSQGEEVKLYHAFLVRVHGRTSTPLLFLWASVQLVFLSMSILERWIFQKLKTCDKSQFRVFAKSKMQCEQRARLIN